MLIFIAAITVMILSFRFAVLYTAYESSLYLKLTGLGFWQVVLDSGRYGEYLIVSQLDKLNLYKKILVNVYLPKNDTTTAEIDIIMLCTKGIFVFESKNYGGWIYGSENSRSWTQTLPNRQKHKFYNPIMQNKSHIAQLDKFLRVYSTDTYKSYVVFGERCKLKSIKYEKSKNSIVTSRSSMLKEFAKCGYESIMPEKAVDNCYEALKPYANVSEQVKERHIKNVRQKQAANK